MLMAMAQPIFSLVLRFKGRRIFQGRSAKARSRIPE